MPKVSVIVACHNSSTYLDMVDKPLVKYRKHEDNISHLEEGKLQIRLGVVAAACHFLRIYGYLDPLTSTEEKTWQKFVGWVDERIVEERTFERHEAWSAARAEYFTGSNKLFAAFRFGSCLLLSGNAVLLIREKIFGSSLPKHLAQEWTKQAKVFVKT